MTATADWSTAASQFCYLDMLAADKHARLQAAYKHASLRAAYKHASPQACAASALTKPSRWMHLAGGLPSIWQFNLLGFGSTLAAHARRPACSCAPTCEQPTLTHEAGVLLFMVGSFLRLISTASMSCCMHFGCHPHAPSWQQTQAPGSSSSVASSVLSYDSSSISSAVNEPQGLMGTFMPATSHSYQATWAVLRSWHLL